MSSYEQVHYVISTFTDDVAWRVQGDQVLFATALSIAKSGYTRAELFSSDWSYKVDVTKDHPIIKRYWPEDSQ